MDNEICLNLYFIWMPQQLLNMRCNTKILLKLWVDLWINCCSALYCYTERSLVFINQFTNWCYVWRLYSLQRIFCNTVSYCFIDFSVLDVKNITGTRRSNSKLVKKSTITKGKHFSVQTVLYRWRFHDNDTNSGLLSTSITKWTLISPTLHQWF